MVGDSFRVMLPALQKGSERTSFQSGVRVVRVYLFCKICGVITSVGASSYSRNCANTVHVSKAVKIYNLSHIFLVPDRSRRVEVVGNAIKAEIVYRKAFLLDFSRQFDEFGEIVFCNGTWNSSTPFATRNCAWTI